ncbi:MAG: preprotein translocase subunit SecG [Spirochaetes bacterium]|nr:preprotein translocase subunit SecG [Spirochaetota bacterium]
MSGIITTLTVIFLIVCVFLILMVLLQSDKNSGMGILGGSSQSAFGSSTADVVTKITAVLVALFLLGSLGLSALESFSGKSKYIDPNTVKENTENTDKPQQ